MYRFKGFVSISSLASNAPDTTSGIGEISVRSMTFTKDVKTYSALTNKEVSVLGFSSKSSVSGKITAPTIITTRAVEIAEWIHTRQKTIAATETLADFLTAFRTAFSTTIASVTAGDMVTASNGKPYPGYIRWKSIDYTGDDNLNTLWMSDAVFQNEYDEYDIIIVPPLANVNAFLGKYTEAVQALGEIDFIKRMQLIQNAIGQYPPTVTTAEKYSYHNTLNSSVTTMTEWTYLIYGPKGNDVDAMQQALIDYLTANSTMGITPWKSIFPDIFKSTEFIIVPKWHSYSINEMSLQSGIYSPISNPKKDIVFLKKVVSEYGSAHIENNTDVMSHPYRSLMLLCIGGAENRDGKYNLATIYPDIISVSSTSLDFNRMATATKEFLLMLSEMLVLAETMTSSTEIPIQFKRSERAGVIYITATYGDVRYLVASKLSTFDFV